MKKILITIAFSLISIITNAQIFENIKYVDKFDDIIKNKNIKTKISIIEIDSTDVFGCDDCYIINIETKNKNSIKYLGFASYEFGNKNNIKELVDDVFGYETQYLCVPLDNFNLEDGILTYCNSYNIDFNNLTKTQIYSISKLVFLSMKLHFLKIICGEEELDKNEYIFANRVVVTEITNTFVSRHMWLEDNNDNRIIYSNK